MDNMVSPLQSATLVGEAGLKWQMMRTAHDGSHVERRIRAEQVESTLQ